MQPKNARREEVLEKLEEAGGRRPGVATQVHRETLVPEVDMLGEDQLEVFTKVMAKLEEWMTTDDLTNFKPLHMILNGAGGSGKSVVLNTIVTYIRKMFGCNGVVRTTALTAASVYNRPVGFISA